MSEPVRLPLSAALLADARAILAKLTPAERADAEQEALAKGVSVEELVARAALQLAREAQLHELGDRRARAAAAELPRIGPTRS